MSIERMFDKLDEKISSLIRSIGVIITLLFGFIALVINYFSFNFIIISIVLVLLIIFSSNIVYTIYVYIYCSSENDKFINKIASYKGVIKLTNQSYHELFAELNDLSFRYNDILSQELLDISLLLDNLGDPFEQKFERSNENSNKYEIEIKKIKEFNKFFRATHEFFEKIDDGLDILIAVSNHINENNKNFIKTFREIYIVCSENIIKYGLRLEKYEDLEVDYTFKVSIKIDDNPFEDCQDNIRIFRYALDDTYNVISYEKDEKRKTYDKKIKISYGIFGFGIIFSCICLFIIIAFLLSVEISKIL